MSRPDVAVISANFGGMDDPVPPLPQRVACDFIYHTDDSSLEVPAWQVIRHTPNGLHPCLAAKKFKMTPPVPHRYVIWVDANIRLESKDFVQEALSHLKDGIAVHSHPFRDCIYAEAVESILTPKYDELPIAEQVRHYHRHEKYPPHGGLFACGVIAWDRGHPHAQRLGRAWLSECQKWGFQDQLSFPVVARRLGIEPGTFPHHQYRSPWLRVLPHLK